MERLRNMGLKRSLFLLSLCGLLLSLLLLLLVWQVCFAVIDQYPSGGYVIQMGGMSMELPAPTPEQARLLRLLRAIPLLGCILFPVSGLVGAGALFYRWKLKRPIALLLEGTRRIRTHDLDFAVPEVSEDELGQVCAAFETMRRELLKTNRELWRQAEERRRLNAAFAHDLRNPVTVLKGSVKLLRQGACDGQTLDRLESYTLRIERYIDVMSSIQRLEQMPVRTGGAACSQLRTELEETARLLAPALDRKISVPHEGTISLDHGIFLTVAENLIANGARFAKGRLEVVLSLEENTATLSVVDDGPGFPAGLLKDGPRPFGKGDDNPEHFGMGLYSCHLLCLKHGGGLRLENGTAGGGMAAASFKINCQP